MTSSRVFAGIAAALILVACAHAETDIALVRHAPSLNGTIHGSLQQMTAESVSFDYGDAITGDFLVPGTPTVRVNGRPMFGGTIAGSGATTPAGYQVTLNGGARLGHLRTRTDAIALPFVDAPATPIGTRSVTLRSSRHRTGDFATLRDLTLSSYVGQVRVPAGVYGNFTANRGSGFTLGVAGATIPSVYAFQRLTLNDCSDLTIVGPVVITVGQDVRIESSVGNPAHPEWLTLQISSGGLTLDNSVSFYGSVLAPNGLVKIESGSRLVGRLAADRLEMHRRSLLRLPAAVNLPPVVALIAPADDSEFTAPASFVLEASASDSNGSIAKVEFFRGSTKLGESTTAPYQFAVTNLPAGDYAFKAKATDNSGTSVVSEPIAVVVRALLPANALPTVALTGPASGSIISAPANFTLTANAADSDGSIAKVEFYRGTTLLGESTTAPYHFDVTGLAAGTYAFTARATDNSGATTTSDSITIISNALPTVALTSPADNAHGVAPTSFTLNANANDADGTITKVEFFVGAAKVGEATTAPYQFIWTDVAVGTYTLKARATDNRGGVGESASVTVNVDPLIINVALTSPSAGATFDSANPIPLTATASTNFGIVTKVEFFDGTTKIGEDTTAPYEFSWTGAPTGLRSLTARATTSAGDTAASLAVGIVVSHDENQVPIVALLTPENGVTFLASSLTNLVAQAADLDGRVSKVEFYQDGALVGTRMFSFGEDGTAPAQVSWTVPDLPGSYVLQAKAYDDAGAIGSSASITVVVTTNDPPTVALTAPASNSVFFEGDTVALAATATGHSGTVTKVEFYAGSTKVGEDSSAPYTFNWLNVPAGNYTLRARAYDDLGNVSISTTRVISVRPPVPYLANFEAGEGYNLGLLAGQKSWTVRGANVQVTDSSAAQGSRSVVLKPSAFSSSAVLTLAPLPSGQRVVFYDLWAKPARDDSFASNFSFDGAAFFLLSNGDQGELWVTTGETFVPTGVLVPLAADGTAANWMRFTVRQDYRRHLWDLYLDGVLIAGDLSFVSSGDPFFAVTGHSSAPVRFDGLLVNTENPLFIDADKDGMDDAWEVAHGLDPTTNDRNGDLDADGVTNFQEYVRRTDPNHAD